MKTHNGRPSPTMLPEDVAEMLLSSVDGLEIGEILNGLVYAIKVISDQTDDPDKTIEYVVGEL